MTLAIRIIPVLLYKGAHLVKPKQFGQPRVVGHALQAAKIMANRGVDELMMLDIGATPASRHPDFSMIRELTAHATTPIAVGGGISTMEDVKGLLDSGADKVVIKTHLELVPQIADKYGSQAVCVAIDYCDWRRIEFTGEVRAAIQVQEQGAGEILLTCMNREGCMEGYDLQTIHAVSRMLSIPVIANGGCGVPKHMEDAIKAGASAVSAGSMFQFTDTTPKGCAAYLADNGVEVRLT